MTLNIPVSRCFLFYHSGIGPGILSRTNLLLKSLWFGIETILSQKSQNQSKKLWIGLKKVGINQANSLVVLNRNEKSKVLKTTINSDMCSSQKTALGCRDLKWNIVFWINWTDVGVLGNQLVWVMKKQSFSLFGNWKAYQNSYESICQMFLEVQIPKYVFFQYQYQSTLVKEFQWTYMQRS